MGLKTFGTMGVDWEERVNFERLRQERLARIKSALKKSEIGALLCFDMNNIRYITNTHIGTWAIDKLGRFCLLPQDDEPINWDFGSAARHHRCTAPGWASARARASPPCAARCIPAPAWPKMWRKKFSSNWKARLAQRAARRGCDRAAGAVRAAKRRHHRRRRSAVDAGSARNQNAG